MLVLRKAKITPLLISILFGLCLWAIVPAAVKAEEPDLSESGCCEMDEKTKNTGEIDKQFVFVLYKSMCSEMCLLSTEEVEIQTCNFELGITEEECDKKDVSVSSQTTQPSSGSSDFPDASGLNQLSSTDVKIIIGNAIKTAMGLMGSVALAMFVYGGILWMSSAGNAERSKKGMQVIVWASLGVFMILASYVIVNFIFSAFS